MLWTIWLICSFLLFVYLLFHERKYKGYVTIFDIICFFVVSFTGPIGIALIVAACLYVFWMD